MKKILLFFCVFCWTLGAQQTQIIDLPQGNHSGVVEQQTMTMFNNKLYTVNAEGQVSIINPVTRSLERIVQGEKKIRAHSLCVSEEMGIVLPAIDDVKFLDPQTGRSQAIYPGLMVSTGCAFRPDGSLVVISRLQEGPELPKVAIIRGSFLDGFKVEQTLRTNAGSINHVVCLVNKDKCYLVINYITQWGMVGVLENGKLVKFLNLPGAAGIFPGSVVIEPGGKLLIRTSEKISVLNTETDEFEEPISPWLFGNITFAGDPALVYTWYSNFGFRVDLYLREGIPGAFWREEGAAIKNVSAIRFPLFDLVAILRTSSLVFVEVPRRPVLHAVVHGANFQPGPVSPGQWVSVFGSSLSFRSVVADRTPLPTELEGTRVWLTAPGRLPQALPLVFASVNQVNFQVPYDVPVGTKVRIEVEGPGPNQGIKSGLVEMEVVANNPALFLFPDGNPIIQRLNGSLTNSVSPGEHITLYATGLGQVQPPVVAGSPAPFNPLARLVESIEVALDNTPCEVLFAGLSPGWVGLYQINVKIPPNVKPGKKPLLIKVKGEVAHSSYLINVGPS